MVGPGELIKNSHRLNFMGLGDLSQVLRQCFRVAGNIKNSFKATDQLLRIRIQPGSGRVDKNRGEVVAIQINMGQSPKGPLAI